MNTAGGIREWTVQGEMQHSVSFAGLLEAVVSTNEDGRRVRWTELRLWRMISAGQGASLPRAGGPRAAALAGLGFPEGDWLYQSRGVSLVFHLGSGGCPRDEQLTELGALPAGAVPCARCWPATRVPRLPAATLIRPEQDRVRTTICATPAEVERAATQQPGRRPDPYLSAPAEDLLAQAADADGELREFLGRPRRLTA
jgi:hypothetical protein